MSSVELESDPESEGASRNRPWGRLGKLLATRRRRIALATVLAVPVVLLGVVTASFDLSSQHARADAPAEPVAAQGGFAWLVPTTAPATWRQLRLPRREGVLSFPPLLHPVAGDAGTVSAATFGPDGAYLAYLNATPLEGGERLEGWAQARLEHLREDDARSVVKVSDAALIRFRGGTGSCVSDEYVTKKGDHAFREIACLVEGGGTGSVVVAAAATRYWSQFAPLLERVVASYSVA